MRIASLNMQNLRLLPDGSGGHLHGARDRDDAESPAHDAADRRQERPAHSSRRKTCPVWLRE